jgi:hypothetical protein
LSSGITDRGRLFDTDLNVSESEIAFEMSDSNFLRDLVETGSSSCETTSDDCPVFGGVKNERRVAVEESSDTGNFVFAKLSTIRLGGFSVDSGNIVYASLLSFLDRFGRTVEGSEAK